MIFNRILREAKPLIDSYIRCRGIENADFLFTTFYLWGRHGKILYAEQDGVLYFHYNFPEEPQFFLPPLTRPGDDYKKAVDTAIAEMRAMGFKPCFRSVSEPLMAPLLGAIPGAVVTPTPFNNDYVYEADKLRTLSGKKLHAKRNHINSLLLEHPDWEYVRIGENNLSECMALYEAWSADKHEVTLEEYDERLTVELAVEHMTELGLVGGGIRLGGRLCAFSVGEQSTRDMFTVHIEKADPDIPGLYPLINREFVLHECEGMTYINREDDMGIEGLRKAKESYHPLRMVEKYMVTLPEG